MTIKIKGRNGKLIEAELVVDDVEEIPIWLMYLLNNKNTISKFNVKINSLHKGKAKIFFKDNPNLSNIITDTQLRVTELKNNTKR